MTAQQAVVQKNVFSHDLLITLGASVFISLFANISIPLFFTPVPIVTQNQVILLLALFLGPKRAFSATLLFLLYGFMGLPVLGGDISGLAKILGPTGGYFIGYLVAAYATGLMFQTMHLKTPLKAFLSMGFGNLMIHFCGFIGMSYWMSPLNALLLGFLPFVLGDLFKLFVGTHVAKVLGCFEKVR